MPEDGQQQKKKRRRNQSTKIPVLGIAAAGKSWFIGGLAYDVSLGKRGKGGYYETVGSIDEGGEYIHSIIENIQKMEERIRSGEDAETILNEHYRNTLTGTLNRVVYSINVRGYLGKKYPDKLLTVSIEDISGEDYKDRAPAFIKCVQDADALIILLDSSRKVSLVEQMKIACSIPLDLLSIGVDIRHVPIAFVFTKADMSPIPEIKKCGKIDQIGGLYEEVIKILAPIKAIIDFHSGSFELFSVSVYGRQEKGYYRPKGFEEVIGWLAEELFNKKHLYKKERNPEKVKKLMIRADQIKYPILGIQGSGKSAFMAAIAQWASLGKKDKKNGKYIPIGFITEGLADITDYLVGMELSGSDIHPTTPGMPKRISIYIDPARMGIKNAKPFEIFTGDISGEDYEEQTPHFQRVMKECSGAIILIDKTSKERGLPDQMRYAGAVPQFLKKNGGAIPFEEMCFAFVYSKSDRLDENYRRYGEHTPKLQNDNDDPVYEEFWHYFSPIISSLVGDLRKNKYDIRQRFKVFTVSSTGGIEKGPIDPKGIGDIVAFIAKRGAGIYKD